MGRTKVDKEITAQEYNDAWIVLIHLEQSMKLQEKQVMKLVKLSMSIEKVVNSKSGGTPMGKPNSNFDGTPISTKITGKSGKVT